MAEEPEEELQVACTIKMKSIVSFFKSPVAASDKKPVTKPKEPTKCDTVAGEHTKGEKCQKENQNLDNGKPEQHAVNGLVVDCKGDSNKPPNDRVKAVKRDRQKVVVKKQNTDILNSSLDEFQTQNKPRSTKKRLQKPKKVKTADVHDEPVSKEEMDPVLEISYEDFMRKNTSSEDIQENISIDDVKQTESEEKSENVKNFLEEKSENVNNFPERKSVADVDAPPSSPVEDVSNKTPARKSRGRHCKAATETPKTSTDECDLTEDEKPRPPAVNIMNYFSASRKGEAKRKSTDQSVVHITAEVHSPPLEPAEHRVFDIFSPKQINSAGEDTKDDKQEHYLCASPVARATARKRSSNVIVESVDVDLTITELESPFVHEDSGKSSAKVMNGSSKQEKVKVASAKINNTGKKVTETLGKKVTEDSGKKVTEASGKKVTEASGKKVAEVSGKKITEASGRKVTEAPGKKVTEASGKKVTEVSVKKITEASEKKVTEAPRKKVTEASGKKVMEASGKNITEALKKKAKVKDPVCTSKSNINAGKETSDKDKIVIDITTDQDTEANMVSSDTKSSTIKDEATTENEALEKRKCSASVKIASLQSITLPTGRSQTQMTLNYSRGKNDGSILQKPVVCRKNKKVTRRRRRLDSDETSDDDTMLADVTRNRRKRQHQEKMSKSQDDNEHVAVCTTPGKGTVSEDVYESVFVEVGCQRKKTPIKLKITRVAKMSTDFADLKIQKKLATLNRAQRLLVKAKTKNGKKPSMFVSSKSCDSDDLRRSSRRSSMAAKSAIMLCYEEVTWKEQQVNDTAVKKGETHPSKRTREKSTETPAEKKGRNSSILKRKVAKTPSKMFSEKSSQHGKVTLLSSDRKGLLKGKCGKPERGSQREGRHTEAVSKGESRKASKSATKMAEVGDKQKTTKKSLHRKGNKKTVTDTTRLAAIFQNNHTPKSGRDSPVIISDSSSEAKEVSAEKRQFLLSGVPQELQKRFIPTTEVDTVNDPPWPLVSHVQQVEIGILRETTSDVVDVWNLPDVSLSIPHRKHDEKGVCVAQKWELGSFLETWGKGSKRGEKFEMKRESGVKLSTEAVSWLLAEVITQNASYPAVRMYKHLMKRRLAAEVPSSALAADKSSSADGKKVEETSGGQENKTGSNKRKLDHVSMETGTGHKNKKSRSSRDRRGDHEGDHKRDHKHDHKRDHKGDHKGDHKSEHKGDRRGDQKGNHKHDHNSDHKVDHNGDHNGDLQGKNDPQVKKSGGSSRQKRESMIRGHSKLTEGKKDAVKSAAESTGKETEKVECSTLWTEKYAPINSAGVLGNSGCVGKLKGWLKEWKTVTDRQARLEARERTKQQKKDRETKPAGNDDSDWWSDQDDFDMGDLRQGDHDSDSDGNELCNTMLIMGPHGIGKTSMVYAVAQELGYKVFEVNASSQRSGKQVLSRLQEATQSHQVSKKNLPDLMSVMSKMCAAPSSAAKKEKKLPTAFTNLFAKTSKTDDVIITAVEKSGGKKEKVNEKKNKKGAMNEKSKKSGSAGVKNAENMGKKEDGWKEDEKSSSGMSDCSKQALDLSSTSVILFEEVDIVFEEDKGFWGAIQTFIETTKRPIILTSTTDQFVERFAVQAERLTLKVPSLMNTTSHLQTICLVENVRTDFSNLLSLVEYLHGDVRRCLLTLQFWLNCGGCSNPVEKDVMFDKKHCKSVMHSDGSVQVVQSAKDVAGQKHVKQNCDDGSKLVPVDTTPKSIIVNEDSTSCVDMCPSPMKSSILAVTQNTEAKQETTLQATGTVLTPGEESDYTTISAHSAPLMHGRFFESILGPSVCCDALQDGVLEMLLDVGSSCPLSQGVDQVRRYHQQGVDLLYSNLLQLLPSSSPPTTSPEHVPKPLPRTDILKTSDVTKTSTSVEKLYDSEKSDDDDNGSSESGKFLSLIVKPPAEDEVAPPSHGCRGNNMCKRAKELTQRSLSCISELHDNLSFLDSCFRVSSAPITLSDDTRWPQNRCRMLPGLSDDIGDTNAKATQNWWTDSCVEDISATVEMYSFRRTKETLTAILEDVDSLEDLDRYLVGESLHVPVAKQHCNPRIQRETDEEVRQCHSVQKAAENVTRFLPVCVQGQLRAVSMDYMPYVRTICKFEQTREATHAKRRFLHYLDHHQMGLKSSSISILCSSFT